MEVNNAVSMLSKLASSANRVRPLQAQETERMHEHSGPRKSSFHGQRSQARHLEQLTKRIEKMSNLLARLQQSSPAFKDASAIMVERTKSGTSSFSFSLTQDASGGFFAEFSIKIQFKTAGETSYTQTAATTPATSEAESAAPVADVDAETVAAPQVTDDRIAQLIEYYRIDVAVAPSGDEAAAADVEEASASEAAPAESETVPAETEATVGNLIDIDADHVLRLQTGNGDEVVTIDAETAGRIHTGGGDDAVLIDAEEVARVGAGAGDDLLDINADTVARIRTGAGDDVANIVADEARRIHTDAGDDHLNINAFDVARIRTGEGDDTLTIEADTITRVDAGEGDDSVDLIADDVSRIETGDGDDALSIEANTIAGVNAGEGDDTLNLTADSINSVNGGAGNDTITLDADDAAIAFGAGGGDDVIDITSIGALAIQIDDALATSSDEMTIVYGEEGSVTLEFASGESLTINDIDNADMISVRIGDENIEIHLSEPPLELDVSA